jgi:hypothetical protein
MKALFMIVKLFKNGKFSNVQNFFLDPSVYFRKISLFLRRYLKFGLVAQSDRATTFKVT